MPIHLPPLTRRRFLAGALAAGAGLLARCGLFAADPAADPHAWALLADPHVAADRAAVNRGVNMAEHLAAVVKEVAALPQRPAGVLVNGDCALKDGQPGDYATLAGLLKPLREAGRPLHLTLGNHDHRDHFLAALGEPKAERPVAGRHVAVVRSPRANFVLLDTLDLTDGTPGRLGAGQLAWLAKVLDAHADKPAVVVGHHNLEPTVPEGKKPGGLLDTAALLKVLEPRRQVKAYVYGHTHVWEVKEHASGIHLVNLPPVAYVFAAGRPSGWVHLALKPDGARLSMHGLDRTHPAHGQTVDLAWRRG
jgi:hypothetical protein